MKPESMITIENTQECFVQLWLQLERTRCLFADHYRRFCIRNILKEWFGTRATDDFIWEVCNSIVLDDDQQVYGYDALPRPKLYPRKHREFLRALVSVVLGIGIRKVSLRDLDAAYSIAFPKSTPINVNKKAPPLIPPRGEVKVKGYRLLSLRLTNEKDWTSVRPVFVFC